jgi:cysteine sulfinate desulfinase/cysteine desulfurase-like protein
MGRRPEIDGGGIRFSLGAGTTEAEIQSVLDLLPGVVERIRDAADLAHREPAQASHARSQLREP